MARHMEPPVAATQTRRPDFQKNLSEGLMLQPVCWTRSDPGTTKALMPAATVRPLATAAASRKSLMRPLVQLPMKHTSTRVPLIGFPGIKSI